MRRDNAWLSLSPLLQLRLKTGALDENTKTEELLKDFPDHSCGKDSHVLMSLVLEVEYSYANY